MGQSSTSTDDVTVSCAPGCRVMPDQARLSAGLSGDVEKAMSVTVTPCRVSEPVGAMTRGDVGCSTTEPPAGLARNVSDLEKDEFKPNKRSVSSTLQMTEPVLLVVQAALFRRAGSFVGSHAALLKARRRRQEANAWAGKPITIWQTTKIWHYIWEKACSTLFV